MYIIRKPRKNRCFQMACSTGLQLIGGASNFGKFGPLGAKLKAVHVMKNK